MSDRFDQHIKSRIYPVETEVPTHLWAGIEQQLRPKKKRRWIFFLIPSLLIFGLYWFITSRNYQTDSKRSELGQEVEPLLSKSELNTPSSEISFDVVSNNAKSDHASSASPSPQQAKLPANSAAKRQPYGNTRATKQSKILSVSNAPIVLNNEPESTSLLDADQENILMDKSTRIYDALSTLDQVSFHPALQFKDPKIDICPSFSNHLKIRPFVEFSLTGGLPDRKLTQNDAEFSDYLTLRDRTERERFSLTAQGLFGIEIGDRLEVKTGLSSTRIYEVFDYVDESATRTITNIITDTIFVNGVPVIETDTSIVTQYGQRIKFSQNRYTTLGLPLLAAYKFKVQQHQFYLQAGAIYNLILWTKGDILSPEEEIVNIHHTKGDSPPIFSRNVGIDFTAALGYELEINETNKLRILCSLRQNFGNFALPEYPLNQRYKHLHLGVSWKHQF